MPAVFYCPSQGPALILPGHRGGTPHHPKLMATYASVFSRRTAAWCLVMVASNACAGGPGSGARARERVDAEDVRASLSTLAADSMEGRLTGSPGAARAARFLANELRRYGVEPAYPASAARDSAYFQRVPIVRAPEGSDMTLLRDRAGLDSVPASRRVEALNVIGIVRGSDPALRDQAVIVGAHFDHVGIGPAIEGDSIYNGADDDASGVVTVLEIARALAVGPPPARTVILLLTTGEEMGLLGTRWYLRDPVVSLENTVADLQVEMVGRPDPEAGGPGRAWLTGYSRSTLGRNLAAAGIPIIDDPRPAQRFFERSDNIAFACRGIPAHTLSSFGMHGDYHTPEDEVERIDFAHLTQVIEAATRAVRLLAAGEAPVWLPEGDPSGDPAICG